MTGDENPTTTFRTSTKNGRYATVELTPEAPESTPSVSSVTFDPETDKFSVEGIAPPGTTVSVAFHEDEQDP